MGRAQTHEQVNVILHSADGFGDTTLIANDAAKVGVKAVAPFGADEWAALLRGENDGVVEAKNVEPIELISVRAPRRGAVLFVALTGSLRCAPTSGYFLATLRVAGPAPRSSLPACIIITRCNR